MGLWVRPKTPETRSCSYHLPTRGSVLSSCASPALNAAHNTLRPHGYGQLVTRSIPLLLVARREHRQPLPIFLWVSLLPLPLLLFLPSAPAFLAAVLRFCTPVPSLTGSPAPENTGES